MSTIPVREHGQQARSNFCARSEPKRTMPCIKREDIKTEIERLEKALKDCSDGGIRRVIEEWIADAKRRLASEQKSE
ncbi:MAG: hypothetical protein WA213_15420 [Terriglobales bacterium]